LQIPVCPIEGKKKVIQGRAVQTRPKGYLLIFPD